MKKKIVVVSTKIPFNSILSNILIFASNKVFLTQFMLFSISL